jgi:hypothetical protein
MRRSCAYIAAIVLGCSASPPADGNWLGAPTVPTIATVHGVDVTLQLPAAMTVDATDDEAVWHAGDDVSPAIRLSYRPTTRTTDDLKHEAWDAHMTILDLADLNSGAFVSMFSDSANLARAIKVLPIDAHGSIECIATAIGDGALGWASRACRSLVRHRS